jgi:hypothetical protein
MKLDLPAQRAYCIALGLISADSGFGATWEDPQAREVCRLLAAMEGHASRIDEAASRLRSAMETVDRRFAGDHVHSVNLNSCGEVGRAASDYDMAVAAYSALQDQLQQMVIGIRHDQGYDHISAFDRLEDHPALTPEQDRARRDLAKLEKHLAGDHHSATPASLRRHLGEAHQRTVTRAPGLVTAAAQLTQLRPAHEAVHADELARLRAEVAEIDPNLLIATAAGYRS